MSDPHFSNPDKNDRANTIWGWVAALAVVALIAFVVFASWSNQSTSGTKPTPAATTKQS